MSNLSNIFAKSIFLVSLLADAAQAANYPCSQRMGGVKRCEGPLFICKNGHTSKSKRNCEADKSSGKLADEQMKEKDEE